LLIVGGYFRARLNIEPFDKILGGMCWAVTGSNYDVDLEFMDDLTLGQKVKLSEKVVTALRVMECPHLVYPHQIQGLDYEALIPVMQWLLKKLMESRDTRSLINRKQGLMHYKLKSEIAYQASVQSETTVDTNKIKNIIFGGRPKRVFKTKRNADVTFQDPKRVHTALREFNDLSANKVFQNIIDQITAMDSEKKQASLKLQRRGTVAGQSKGLEGELNASDAAIKRRPTLSDMQNVGTLSQVAGAAA